MDDQTIEAIRVLWRDILGVCQRSLTFIGRPSGGVQHLAPYWIQQAREARARLWELKDFAI